ncbi:MAG TPA: hypothetical protein PKA62_19990 [Thermoanaerobaculia bacterium]|nr:hypothetical protein [Thermoanaerobaculia bacterium]
MRGRVGLWLLALLLTLSSAVFQRLTGPTHPVRGTVTLGGTEVRLRLLRSHGGDGDQPVVVKVADRAVSGSVAWRRYPTSDPFAVLPMVREGETLRAALPHQPPAGKLEYQVRLARGGETALFPERPAITRFKGAVSPVVLVPHIVAMFGGMLVANAAGLLALRGEKRLLGVSLAALALLALGGLLLGPLVQKAAFGAYWTGWPFGTDLTDNKTAVAVLAWGVAALRARGGRGARAAVVVAALVTLAVFLVPHSAWGSQIDWSKIPAGGGS